MKPTILPVIHTVDFNQVIYNADLCYNNGIRNIFLITHSFTNKNLMTTNLNGYFHVIKNKYPDMKVGVNYLHLSTLDAMKEAQKIKTDFLWADKSFINKDNISIAEEIADNSKDILYFGCVAFKYQKPEIDLEWTCKKACTLMDVVTTSGELTGLPPTLEKIQTIRNYIGDKPLAIASGVTAENKHIYDDLVDYYLVASSIIDQYNDTEYIIESKLKDLIK